MKKNVMMRAASFLLVAVLLTTSIISGTYAKYITSASGNDSARVAYWGFKTTTLELGDLFSPQYIQTKENADGTVKSGDGDDVIAPGTSGSIDFGFGYEEIAGTAAVDTTAQVINAPEVKYEFRVEATGNCSNDIKNNPNIHWTLDSVACDSFDDLLTKIEALAGDSATDGVQNYMPGELPAKFTTADDTHTIGWSWDYEETGDSVTNDQKAAQDTTDTTMGNKTTLDTCSIAITITAKQLD